MKFKTLTSAILIAVIAIACSKDDSSDSNNAQSRFSRFGGGFGSRVTSVEIQEVKTGAIAKQVRSFGTVQAQDIVSVIPQVSNRILKMYVDLGDTVKKGQVLAKIYDVPFKGQVEGSKAQIRQARVALSRDSSQFARQQKLFESGLTSEFDFQNAQATYLNSKGQLDAAIANLAQSQENLTNTEVKSPVNGVITARFAEEGNLAANGQPLFEVANLVGYESRIFVPVQDWSQIKIGQEVSIRPTNEAEPAAKGVVSRKSPQLDATTGLGEIVVSLVQTGPSIYPGVLTENIITIESKRNAVIVNRSSLVEKVETLLNPESNSIELERSYAVFVANGDSIAERRVLDLGIEQGEFLEVVGGIQAGEKIITTGQTGLTDGAKIKVATGENFTSPAKTSIAGDGNQTGWGSRPNQVTSSDSTTSPRTRIGNNMTPEQRAELRQKMANMSPEERRAYMQEMRARRDSSQTNR